MRTYLSGKKKTIRIVLIYDMNSIIRKSAAAYTLQYVYYVNVYTILTTLSVTHSVHARVKHVGHKIHTIHLNSTNLQHIK